MNPLAEDNYRQTNTTTLSNICEPNILLKTESNFCQPNIVSTPNFFAGEKEFLLQTQSPSPIIEEKYIDYNLSGRKEIKSSVSKEVINKYTKRQIEQHM